MVYISCKNCHQVYKKNNYNEFVCTKCNHKVRRRVKNSLQISLALTICAALLYIPAMVYPIMEVTNFGISSSSTIIQGVISFLEHKNYFIAAVIFIASIVIPLIKIIGLLVIFTSLKFKLHMTKKTKLKVYNFIEFIGKWSMIDIYVVAILASVIQVSEIFKIKGEIAVTSFTLVVLFTMTAAQKFDTRIIWDE